MKKNLYLLIAAVAVAVLFFASFVSVDSLYAAEADDEVKYHTVVRGDTLWDISEKHLKDPFRWPSIWKKNPQIANPHLIYPGDIVKFTRDSVEVVRNGKIVTRLVPEEEDFEEFEYEDFEEEVVEEEEDFEDFEVEEIIEEGPAVFRVPGTMKDGFITKEALKLSGVILESKGSKHILAADDEVFVSFKKRDDVMEGDIYTIFKEGRELRRDDEMRTLIGHVIKIVGTIEITFDGRAAEARIVKSYQEVEKGMKLTDYIEPVKEVEIVEADKRITAIIMAADSDVIQIAANNLIYLDKGGNAGFTVGNVLEISRPRSEVDDPLKKRSKIQLPNRVIGKAVVVRVTDTSAVGFVASNIITIAEGDTVITGPYVTLD